MLEAEICAAAPDDFEEVLKLLKQLWPEKQLERESLLHVYMEALDSPQQKYIVGKAAQEVVGFISLRIIRNLWAQGNLLYIEELVVDEKYRNMKIGSSLIEQAIKFAEENRCKGIEVTSAFHRHDAHRFYEKCGFAKKAYHFLCEMPGF